MPYNNRKRHCYNENRRRKYAGGSDPPTSSDHPTSTPDAPDAPDAHDAILRTMTVDEVHEFSRQLPPLGMSHEDALSEPDEVTWTEFVEHFWSISDDADRMQDDLLPNLERRAASMPPSADKEALVRMITTYGDKLRAYFDVLSDIEADIEMLERMMASGIVGADRVEACISDDPPPEGEGNWDAYADLATRLHDQSLPASQSSRLIAETRAEHGDLTPIGLVSLLDAHYRSFAKWEANIDAWNSVLEEGQHHHERDARYRQAVRDGAFQGTMEQYEQGTRASDAVILRQMDELRAMNRALEHQLCDSQRALGLHDPASPEHTNIDARITAIRESVRANKSSFNALHSSLSPLSLWEHVRFDDDSLGWHDVTSDYGAKISKHGLSGFAPPAQKRRSAATSVVHTSPTKSTRPPPTPQLRRPIVLSPRCECQGLKSKRECENKPGCRWLMGVGCRKAPDGRAPANERELC